MATKTTINFDDEMEAALAELVAIDGTKRLAIKRSLLAEVKRRRRSQAMIDLIASWKPRMGKSTPSTSRGPARCSTGRESIDDHRCRPVDRRR